MKTKNIAGLTVTMALLFIICEFSLAGDDFLKSMESDFIKIVEDVGPAIVEVSAALKSSWTVIESPSKDVADLEKSIVDMEIQLEVLKKTLPIADPEIIKLQDQIAASREALKHGEHTVATWSLMDEHRPSVRENVGTGIIIDRSGYIVTTQSVVGGAKSVQVTWPMEETSRRR
jgi:S1-C subfamily serine protease